MKTMNEILALEEVTVDAVVIEEWIELQWLKPVRKEQVIYFEEIDIARIHLIDELRHRMMIEYDAIPVVLSLLDQLYTARAKLGKLVGAIEQQPQDIQTNIFSLLSNADD